MATCWALKDRLEKRGYKLVKNGDKQDKEGTEVKASDMYGGMKTLNEFLGNLGFGIHSMGTSTNS